MRNPHSVMDAWRPKKSAIEIPESITGIVIVAINITAVVIIILEAIAHL